jgi:hypothetical protein
LAEGPGGAIRSALYLMAIKGKEAPNRRGIRVILWTDWGRVLWRKSLAIATSGGRATATTSGATGLSLVDADRAPLDVATVELLNRSVGSLVGSHLDKAESTRAIGRAIHDYLRTVHFASFRENIVQILISDSPSQIPNIQSAAH